MTRPQLLLPVLLAGGLLLCACGQDPGRGSAGAPAGGSPPAHTSEFDFAPGGPIPDGELGAFHVVLSVVYRERPLGDMVFELWPDASPLAVRRFLRHCAEGAYDGSPFHRVIREYVVQGGDPTGSGRGASPYGTLVPEASVDPAHRHGYGVLSMTDPPSLQFFVCTTESPRVWALDEQPLSRLGRLSAGVATLEQVANVEVGFTPNGEKSRPLEPVVVERARVVRGAAPREEVVARPPVDLQGQPEVVAVEHIWVTFTERARGMAVNRNRLQAEARAIDALQRVRSGELAWEDAVREYSDEPRPPVDQPLPRRRMSNFGVLRLQGQRAGVDGRQELRELQNQLRSELAAGLISTDELRRQQDEKTAEVEARIRALGMERREDINELSYTEVAFGLELGEVGLVEYDPYTCPYGWYILRRVE